MPIEQYPIIDREQWLALRQRDVTASVAAALLGEHPYVSAFGLWALKTRRIAEDEIETPSMRRGRLLEPVALALLAEMQPDWQAHNPKTYYRDPDARLGATPDAVAYDPERALGVVQFKSVQQWVFSRKWRDDDGNVELPLWIAVQALTEAHLAGAQWAAVAALVVDHGLDLHIVDVPLIPGVIERVYSEVADFWQTIERGVIPPPDWKRDSAIAAQVLHPLGSVDLSNDNELPGLLQERASLKTRIKAACEAVDDIDAAIKAKLTLAEQATLPGWKLIFKQVQTKPYSVSAKITRPLKVYRTDKTEEE